MPASIIKLTTSRGSVHTGTKIRKLKNIEFQVREHWETVTTPKDTISMVSRFSVQHAWTLQIERNKKLLKLFMFHFSWVQSKESQEYWTFISCPYHTSTNRPWDELLCLFLCVQKANSSSFYLFTPAPQGREYRYSTCMQFVLAMSFQYSQLRLHRATAHSLAMVTSLDLLIVARPHNTPSLNMPTWACEYNNSENHNNNKKWRRRYEYIIIVVRRRLQASALFATQKTINSYRSRYTTGGVQYSF